MTVVGYGVDMPDYSESNFDTICLMVAIMIGTIIFSKFTGGLQVIFAKDRKDKTILDKIMILEEGLQAYTISHNT
jgi:hypothetical protein